MPTTKSTKFEFNFQMTGQHYQQPHLNIVESFLYFVLILSGVGGKLLFRWL